MILCRDVCRRLTNFSVSTLFRHTPPAKKVKDRWQFDQEIARILRSPKKTRFLFHFRFNWLSKPAEGNTLALGIFLVGHGVVVQRIASQERGHRRKIAVQRHDLIDALGYVRRIVILISIKPHLNFSQHHIDYCGQTC